MRFLKLLSVLAGLAVASAAATLEASPSQTLFANVKVFDGVHEDLIVNANVLVEGNLIKQVSTKAISAEGATVIDGKGRTLIPGLIDAHWHVMFSEPTFPELMNADQSWLTLLGARGAHDTLMRGFTTVRDVGGNPFSIKKAIDRGMIEGPRIYPSGANITQTSGHSDGRHPADPGTPLYLEKQGQFAVADGVPAVLTAVREQLRMGATQVKLSIGGGVSSNYDPLDVSEYTLDELKAAVEAARSWNTYVARQHGCLDPDGH